MNYTSNVQPAAKVNNKTKADIILDLVMSLNLGNCGTIADRPNYAIEQYRRLVAAGIIENK